MSKTIFYYTFSAAILLMACNGNKPAVSAHARQFPKPGTSVAKAQMSVKEDALNDATFKVEVIADSAITKGVYDVDADFGPGFGEGQFTMPTGIEDAKPVIRKGSEPYTFIVGFRLPNDTTFYDYFQVSATKHSIKMEYIKSYSF